MIKTYFRVFTINFPIFKRIQTQKIILVSKKRLFFTEHYQCYHERSFNKETNSTKLTAIAFKKGDIQLRIRAKQPASLIKDRKTRYSHIKTYPAHKTTLNQEAPVTYIYRRIKSLYGKYTTNSKGYRYR